MALTKATFGGLITSAIFNNNTYNLFKGVATYEDTIILADNVAGTLQFKPTSDPGSTVETVQIAKSDGTRLFAVRSDGSILSTMGASIGTLNTSNVATIAGVFAVATTGNVGIGVAPAGGTIMLNIQGNNGLGAGAQIQMLSSTSTGSVLSIGRTAVDADFIASDGVANFLLDAMAGDVVIDNRNATGNIRFGNKNLNSSLVIQPGGIVSTLAATISQVYLSGAGNINAPGNLTSGNIQTAGTASLGTLYVGSGIIAPIVASTATLVAATNAAIGGINPGSNVTLAVTGNLINQSGPIGFQLIPTIKMSTQNNGAAMAMHGTWTINSGQNVSFVRELWISPTAMTNSGTVGSRLAIDIGSISSDPSPASTNYGIRIGDISGASTNYSLYTGAGLVRLGGGILIGGDPTATASMAGIGLTTGVGSGANANIQAPAQGGGSGPATLTVQTWLRATIGTTTGWIPFFI